MEPVGAAVDDADPEITLLLAPGFKPRCACFFLPILIIPHTFHWANEDGENRTTNQSVYSHTQRAVTFPLTFSPTVPTTWRLSLISISRDKFESPPNFRSPINGNRLMARLKK